MGCLITLLKKQKKMNKPEFPLIPRHSYKLAGLDESYLHLNQILKIHYEESISSKQTQKFFSDLMTLSKTWPCTWIKSLKAMLSAAINYKNQGKHLQTSAEFPYISFKRILQKKWKSLISACMIHEQIAGLFHIW